MGRDKYPTGGMEAEKLSGIKVKKTDTETELELEKKKKPDRFTEDQQCELLRVEVETSGEKKKKNSGETCQKP